MRKRLLLASSICVTLLAGAAFPLSADAQIRPHGGTHASGHVGGHFAGHAGRGGNRGGYRGGRGGVGFGGFNGGYYGGFCGPIQVVLGLCGPFGY